MCRDAAMQTKPTNQSRKRRKPARINTAPSKLRVYEALHALNQGFEQVLTDLGRLEELGFRGELLREFRVVVEETRAWANFELIETMQDREERDWARFGRLRYQQEKKLRDPHDVLIEAERLKQKQAVEKKLRKQNARERAR